MEAGYCRKNIENVLAICSFWRWKHFSPLEWISFVSGESFGLKNTNVKCAMLGENGCHRKGTLSGLACQWWCYWWEVDRSVPGLCLSRVGEVFIWTQIGWDCWNRLGDLVFWCVLSHRGQTQTFCSDSLRGSISELGDVSLKYLSHPGWGWGSALEPRKFLMRSRRELDQSNSKYLPWLQTQSLVRMALNSWRPEIRKALSWEGSKYVWLSGSFFQTFVPALSWDSEKFKPIIEPVVWQRVVPKIAWGDPWGFWALQQAEQRLLEEGKLLSIDQCFPEWSRMVYSLLFSLWWQNAWHQAT